MFSEHMLDKRMFGDLVNPDKLILQGTENLNFTEWTEMNLKLNIISENDIAEFKKNVQCAFQKKDLKMCLVNVKKRFFQKRT